MRLQVVNGGSFTKICKGCGKTYCFGDCPDLPSRSEAPLFKGCVDLDHPEDHYCIDCLDVDGSGNPMLLVGFRDVNWGGQRF
jgi:hypothetical protein